MSARVSPIRLVISTTEFLDRRDDTRSLAIPANQPFSAWDRIFADPAVTVAAIDRPVHRATILEMNVDSCRRREAADRMLKKADAAPTASANNLEEDATAQAVNSSGRPGQFGCHPRT
jgi:hypothetical protein